MLRDELGVVIVLVALVAVVGAAHPPFLHQGNLLATAQNSSYVGLMAIGMVFPLAMREVDLSVGGNFAFGIVLGATLMVHGWTPWLAAFALVAACALLGALNGLITTFIDAPSFIVTLATSLLFRGARWPSPTASRSPGCRPRTRSSTSSAAASPGYRPRSGCCCSSPWCSPWSSR